MLSPAIEDFSRISEVLPIPPPSRDVAPRKCRIPDFAGMSEEKDLPKSWRVGG
jgi:hypothetical protein